MPDEDPSAASPLPRRKPKIPKAIIVLLIVLAIGAAAVLYAVLHNPAAPASQAAQLPALERSCQARTAVYGKVFSNVDAKFAGVRAYGKTLRELDASKPWSAEAATVKNPDFWRALMEMVPQDPSVAFSAAYLYALQGEPGRAQAWLLLGGLLMEPRWASDRDNLRAGIKEARAETDAVIKRGTALHDAGKYSEAIAVYDGVLAGAPRNAWALYEKSFALLAADEPGSAKVREEMYKTIREIDPFDWQAYQGTDRDVVNRKLPVLLSDVMPFISGKAGGAEGLAKFASGCEKAGIHDFAALAYWKLILVSKENDQAMAHFFFNLKRQGLDAFVKSVAGDDMLKSVALIEAQNPPALAGDVEAKILQYGLYQMPDGKVPSLLRADDQVPAERGVAFGYVAMLPGLSPGVHGWKAVFLHPPMNCPESAASVRSSDELTPARDQDTVMILFRFDRDCELVKGRWTMQVVHEEKALRVTPGKDGTEKAIVKVSPNERVVLTKDFEVVAPLAAAAAAFEPAVAAPAAPAVDPEEKNKIDGAIALYCGNEAGVLCHDVQDDPRAVKKCLLGQDNEVLSTACKGALGLR